MQLTWFIAVIFALVAVVAGEQCPASFQLSGNKCVAERPIHGTCPSNSEYSIDINKCVYGKRK